MEIIKGSADNFDEIISKGDVLVDFFANHKCYIFH